MKNDGWLGFNSNDTKTRNWHTYIDMWADMCADVWKKMCTEMYTDMCTKTCTDIWTEMYTDMWTDMRTDMCSDMRTDMRADMRQLRAAQPWPSALVEDDSNKHERLNPRGVSNAVRRWPMSLYIGSVGR